MGLSYANIMSTRREFIFFITAILVLIFALFQASEAGAAVLDVKVLYLDQSTVARGYTVKSADENFWLPVLPSLYSEPVTVKIETLSIGTPIPDDRQGVSQSYIYDIKKSEPGVFDKSVIVAVKMTQPSETAVVCFYDRSQQRWRELPTTIDSVRGLAIAKTVFPYAEVMVMTEGQEQAPVPVILSLEEQLTAQSAIVIDQDGNVLFEKNADEVRPIASLTKLVTAAVFLDYNPGWDKQVTIVAADNVGGASVPFEPGDVVSAKDLFYATLVGSKNNAARALMRASGLSEVEFISAMNQKVKSWGLINTKFVEPTGLSELNVSTAREMMEISRKTLSQYEYLQASTTLWYEIKYTRGAEAKTFWCRNTNQKLLERDLYVTGGKTGFTYEAGYNLVTKARLTKDSNRELIALVLGAKISMNYEEVYLLLKKFL
ncbi:TPA: hypothetical protein DF272_05915 [Candidatus Falkowbacteria bacterium]|nr:hypothetical protein [Candidatus Falkowbacteria bacterium]